MLLGTTLFFILCIWALASIVFWSLRNGISPMPTSYQTRKALLKFLPNIGKGKIYDLGSGWGTLVFPLSKKFPDNQVIGYETSPIPYFFSQFFAWISPHSNLELKRIDFYTVSLSDADLVVCYLYPHAMVLLKKKFEQELKPGTWVLSNTFAIPGWSPYQVYKLNDLFHTKLYLYQIDKKIFYNYASKYTEYDSKIGFKLSR